jgi:hypothetical protein
MTVMWKEQDISHRYQRQREAVQEKHNHSPTKWVVDLFDGAG